MPIKRIPGTSQVYFSNPHTGDIVLNLNDFPEIDESQRNEDVPVMGAWEDYSGSGGKPAQEVTLAGHANELSQDKQALAEGAEFSDITTRGNKTATHRTRPKLVYIESG